MKTKCVYVVSTPRTIMGVYESRRDALDRFTDLFDLIDDLRLTCEVVIPDLPF